MELITLIAVLAVGALFAVCAFLLAMRFLGHNAPERVEVSAIAERVRAVGKLVGLEVRAKEIATARKGFAWMPPIILSQARLAMIFHFEKQYWADLSSIDASRVRRTGSGRYRVTLPPLHSAVRLVEMTPYDIADGRVLGVLDVIPMNAERQKELMDKAQAQASELLTASEDAYLLEAQNAIGAQIRDLLGLFGAEVEVRFEQVIELEPEAERASKRLTPDLLDEPVRTLSELPTTSVQDEPAAA